MTPKTQAAVKLPELPEPEAEESEMVRGDDGVFRRETTHYYTAEQMHKFREEGIAAHAAAPADAGGVGLTVAWIDANCRGWRGEDGMVVALTIRDRLRESASGEYHWGWLIDGVPFPGAGCCDKTATPLFARPTTPATEAKATTKDAP